MPAAAATRPPGVEQLRTQGLGTWAGGKSAVGVGRGVGGWAQALPTARCVLSLAAEAGTSRSAERPESGRPENIRGVAKCRPRSFVFAAEQWSSVVLRAFFIHHPRVGTWAASAAGLLEVTLQRAEGCLYVLSSFVFLSRLRHCVGFLSFKVVGSLRTVVFHGGCTVHIPTGSAQLFLFFTSLPVRGCSGPYLQFIIVKRYNLKPGKGGAREWLLR